jgi:hypothetical protein
LCRASDLVNAKKRRFPVLGAPAALPAGRWIAENLDGEGGCSPLPLLMKISGYTKKAHEADHCGQFESLS